MPTTAPHLAFATSLTGDAGQPKLLPGDQACLQLLAAAGYTTSVLQWNGPLPDALPDVVVIRTTWNYHLQVGAFLAWVEGLATRGVRVLNSPETLRWNHDKRYLLAVQAAGLPVVPSLLAEDAAQVVAFAQEQGVSEVVLKPRVSATAHRTERLAAEEGAVAAYLQAAEGQSTLAQPYMPAIATGGEWSLMYFGGRYSHGVLKQAQAGDFRVQADFGGRVLRPEVPATVLQVGQRFMDWLAALLGTPLYARVDLLAGTGAPLLMELELIEPELFVDTPEVQARFVAAIQQAVGG